MLFVRYSLSINKENNFLLVRYHYKSDLYRNYRFYSEAMVIKNKLNEIIKDKRSNRTKEKYS